MWMVAWIGSNFWARNLVIGFYRLKMWLEPYLEPIGVLLWIAFYLLLLVVSLLDCLKAHAAGRDAPPAMQSPIVSVESHARVRGSALMLGDSIALGTGRVLGVYTVARQSMGSCWVAARVPSGYFDLAAISAGINDAPGPCLEQIRAKIHARVVVWVLPAPINTARAHVEAVAARFGDATVSYACAGACSRVNFHPGSYAKVAADVRQAWSEPWASYSRPILPPAEPKSQISLGSSLDAMISAAAARNNVPTELMRRIVRVESRGNCAVNRNGVMQVLPSAAAYVGVHGDLRNCELGLEAGARYLRQALERARGDWIGAATLYNHGLWARAAPSGYSRLVMVQN